MNPLFGSTDAVTLPLAILYTSPDKLEIGILNNPSPLPLNEDADIVVFTLNPKLGDMDAVALPLAILTASPDIFAIGILNKSLPLPLNEPLNAYALTESLTNKLPLTVVSPTNKI